MSGARYIHIQSHLFSQDHLEEVTAVIDVNQRHPITTNSRIKGATVIASFRELTTFSDTVIWTFQEAFTE
jgi:hypothetical protein